MYPKFANRYVTTSATVAAVIARGKVRCGSRVSPAEKVTYCQPSYAHNTPIIAVPNPVRSDGVTDDGQRVAAASRCGCPNTISPIPITSSAPTFSAVIQFCSVELSRVPRTLIAAVSAITPIATTREATSPIGRICARYPENATASVAMDPLAMTKKLVHPKRNAGSGPKASRMNAYNPPASGFIAPSSAYVSAPSNERPPATIQTSIAVPACPPVCRSTTPGTR